MIAEKERPVLELIRQIKAGSLDPRQLPAAERQACVMHLSAEGLSVPEIGQVLKRSDRTIARDRRAIQEANALQQDPRFAGETAGVLINEAEACISHIRRAVRAADTPAAVRVEAERAIFAIRSELCQRLQSLGFLYTATHRVEAYLTHGYAELPSFDELKTELQRLLEVEISDPRAVRELADLQVLLNRVGYQYSADAGNPVQGPFCATPSRQGFLHICAGSA